MVGFQSLTIRARLLWLTFGLLAPLVLMGFVNLWEFREASIAQVNESVERQAQLAATAFGQHIEAQRQTMETISILAANNESRVALTEYLNSIVKTRPNWLDVQILNREGEIVLAQSYKSLDLPAISVEALRNEVAQTNSFAVVTEQTEDRRLSLLSLALATANGFIVARIDGASANSVFENLSLPQDNIIAVFGSSNQLIYRSGVSPDQISLDTAQTPLLVALTEKRDQTIEVESPYDGILRVYGLARIELVDATVVVGIPSRTLYEPARQRFFRQVFFSLLVLALAMAAAYAIALGIVNPMRRLTEAARRFGSSDLRERVIVEGGGSSIGELGTTFNQMAEEIEQREDELKTLDRLKSEFVSNVSHELRTPLTTIKTLTRVLQRNKSSAVEREEFLETIAKECDRQIDFVQNLLNLSRIESGAFKISLAPVDVVTILRGTIEAHTETAVSRRLSLDLNLPQDNLPHALTDPVPLRQIFSILVENAMKYTSEGGEIVVAASRINKRVAVEFTDSGCGVRAEDLPHIFEKFYRGCPLEVSTGTASNSDDRNTGDDECLVNETFGIGLGLYLAHNLVAQIGGEILVESPANETRRGAKFTVLLPIAG